MTTHYCENYFGTKFVVDCIIIISSSMAFCIYYHPLNIFVVNEAHLRQNTVGLMRVKNNERLSLGNLLIPLIKTLKCNPSAYNMSIYEYVQVAWYIFVKSFFFINCKFIICKADNMWHQKWMLIKFSTTHFHNTYKIATV